MVQTAIQLYSLRALDEPHPGVLNRIGETSFDGVEFAHRVRDANREEVVRVLERTGLKSAGAHVDLESLEEDFRETVDFYDRLGCDTVVVPYLDESHFESVDAVESTANRLSDAASDLSAHGIDLHDHNHENDSIEPTKSSDSNSISAGRTSAASIR